MGFRVLDFDASSGNDVEVPTDTTWTLNLKLIILQHSFNWGLIRDTGNVEGTNGITFLC